MQTAISSGKFHLFVFTILIRLTDAYIQFKRDAFSCFLLLQVSTAWQNHFCFTTPRRDKKGLKFELFPEEPRAEAAAHGYVNDSFV